MCLIVTWTICRGCTESVGKFPRPWTGTVSPRIESKRCTCSQDNTQNRRHCSDTSPEDMAMERTTELYKNAKTSDLFRQITPPSNTEWIYLQMKILSRCAILFCQSSRYRLYRNGSWSHPAALTTLYSQSACRQQCRYESYSVLEMNRTNGFYIYDICIRASHWFAHELLRTFLGRRASFIGWSSTVGHARSLGIGYHNRLETNVSLEVLSFVYLFNETNHLKIC